MVIQPNPLHVLKPRPYRVHWCIRFDHSPFIGWYSIRAKRLGEFLGNQIVPGNYIVRDFSQVKCD